MDVWHGWSPKVNSCLVDVVIINKMFINVKKKINIMIKYFVNY